MLSSAASESFFVHKPACELLNPIRQVSWLEKLNTLLMKIDFVLIRKDNDFKIP